MPGIFSPAVDNSTMKVTVLASGSKGNCTCVEGESGALLIDAGLSAREARKRMAAAGLDESVVGGILVTHEHSDHLKGVDVLARRLDVPVIATEGTLAAFLESRKSRAEVKTEVCRPDEALGLGDFSVTPFLTAHDAAEPCGFMVEEAGAVFGCCTDTGMISSTMTSYFGRCDGLMLESNHCPVMLEEGPYPVFLKRRISDTKRGHLSNNAAAACLREIGGDLSSVILAHLSEVNNTPEKAYQVSETGLGLYADDVSIQVAAQHEFTPTLEV